MDVEAAIVRVRRRMATGDTTPQAYKPYTPNTLPHGGRSVGFVGFVGRPDGCAAWDPFPPAWLERCTYEQLERLAIRTVDGRLTDAEALAAEGLN